MNSQDEYVHQQNKLAQIMNQSQQTNFTLDKQNIFNSLNRGGKNQRQQFMPNNML